LRHRQRACSQDEFDQQIILLLDEMDQVLEWAEERPFSQREIKNAWEVGQSEGENVSTLWELVQGLTASARQIPYTNIRVNLERSAGNLLNPVG
jgi:RNAse (barnase) inhibitor barstar